MHLHLADTIFGLTTPQFALFVSAIAIIWTIRRWRLLSIKKAATVPAPEQRATINNASTPNPARLREVSAEVAALLADIEETARRLTAQLDNRYTRLEQLLAEADEKIRRLESLAQQTPTLPQPIARPAQLTDAQRTLQKLRHERGAPEPGNDPAYQPIYSLSDAGKSTREIAQQLQRQPGEIELILALRSQ